MKTFSIIGGDKRMIYLANELVKDENTVFSYGHENISGIMYNEKIKKCDSLEDAITKSKIVISSIPFSKDGIEIYAPYAKENIELKDLSFYLNNKIFLAGNIPEGFLDNENVKKIDFMKQESLTILNTIATAEGAIANIITNTQINIQDSKILILGFGRVAKVLAKKLLLLDAKVTCAARKETDYAWMEALGYNIENINQIENKLINFDIIINTVPQIILDRNKLNKISKDCLIIDLASKPGGVDPNACEELKINYIWALALPGKYSPLTSAKYIKKTIYNLLEEN